MSNSAVVVRANRGQFNGMFSDVWACVVTGFDVGNLIDAAGESETLTIPGVKLGDMVLGFSLSIDLQDITFTADVTAADTVIVRAQNEGAATVNLASATAYLLIGRPDPSFFNNVSRS